MASRLRPVGFVLLIGGLALAAAGTVIGLTRGVAPRADFGPDSMVGVSAAVTTRSPEPRATSRAMPSTAVGDQTPTPSSARSPTPLSSTTTSTASDRPPMSMGRPIGLTLPTSAAAATVVPVIARDGVLAPPDDPRTVGWWLGSALPGSATGATVIVGHVDSVAGPGALFTANDLEEGDRLSVRSADGTSIRYDVVSRHTYDKNPGLPPTVLNTGGPARLVLITCGGTFDRSTGSYEQNVVVTAVPAPH